MLIRRSLPTPDANSVASATRSFHLRVELLNSLHWTLIDGPPVRLKPDTTLRQGLGTRNVALIIALPLAT